MIHTLRIWENEKETVSFYAKARGFIDLCFISSHWMWYALLFKNANSHEPLVGYVIKDIMLVVSRMGGSSDLEMKIFDIRISTFFDDVRC